jgi:hypothetical protein
MQDGRAVAELRLAMMTGWAPAASQPRPLKPGTGQISLANLFGADEA